MKISQVRKIMIKSHFGLVMAITILLVSCTKDKTIGDLTTPKVNDNITSSAKAQGFSDEDVFQGVMFLEGPVADKLSDLKEFNIRNLTSDQKQIQNSLDFQTKIIEALKNSNPNYLKDFRKKIGSNDYYTVKSAIEQASNDVFNTAITLSGESRNKTLTDAKALSENFKNKYHLTESSSKEDILNAMKSESKSVQQRTTAMQTPPSVSFSVYMSVFVGVMAVVMIMLVLTVMAADPEDFGIAGNRNANSFLTDSFLSEVTLNLSHI